MTSTINADKIMNSSGDQDSGVDLLVNDTVKIKTANTDRITVTDATTTVANDLAAATIKTATVKHTGGTTGLTMDSSGYVFKPAQPFTVVRYAANTEHGAYNSGSNRNNVICKPSNIQINQGSNYNTSTGIFTCPVAGIYEVSFGGNHYGNGISNYFFIWIRKNGTETDRVYAKNYTTDWQQITRTSYISCAANDELTITNENDGTSGGGSKGGWDITTYSYFSYRLIG